MRLRADFCAAVHNKKRAGNEGIKTFEFLELLGQGEMVIPNCLFLVIRFCAKGPVPFNSGAFSLTCIITIRPTFFVI